MTKTTKRAFVSPNPNAPAGTKLWTDADDAVLHEGYRAHGIAWCRERLPGRTPAAIQQRAHKIGAAASVVELRAIKAAARAKLAAARANRAKPAQRSAWVEPAPRYASVWALAQGVAV